MLILYSVALGLVLAVGAPWWLLRMVTSGKYREGLTERLGIIPRRIRRSLDEQQGRPLIWLHAVSVGEVLAASRLIDELGQSFGSSANQPWQVVVSTTTRTGQKLARERFGAGRVFYLPLDFAFAVRAWLRVLRPRMVVLVETEFWPRLLVECRRAGIPAGVVNARISDRSWPRYRRLRRLWRPLLNGLAAVLAQTDLDADRLRALGAGASMNGVQVAGNLKYDIRTAKPAPITALIREQLPPATRVLVCGSTLPGEEELILDALPPDAVTILAPRHPERFEAVAQLVTRRKAPWVRRSRWGAAPTRLQPGTVLLLDSIGELASVYSLASAAFVGGSLVPAGGHNPLEPAQFGVPILMGPSYENFRGIVERLREHDAIRIIELGELSPALNRILADDPQTQAMGARARLLFEREAGATARVVQALTAVLEQSR